jgi:hypothetical protein
VTTTSIDHPDVKTGQQLVARILASRHFVKAPLLSAFLAYICERRRDSETVRIAEQEIGVAVFGRPPGYDSREDNIVRNYARQLRKRLDEYYAAEGIDEQLRVDIPKGGYVPIFTLIERTERVERSMADPGPESAAEPFRVPERQAPSTPSHTWGLKFAAVSGLLCVLLLVAIALRTHQQRSRAATTPSSRLLWKQLFFPNQDTLFVPGDTAFVTLEDMQRKTFSLKEYTAWSSVEQPESSLASELKTRKYTSIVDLEIISKLERLPEVDPDHCVIRTVRSVTVEDLKGGNLILLGSIYSIPWIELLQNNLNFHFIYKPSEHRAWIENRNPASGEASVYANIWNGPAEKAYAVIALIPNLNDTGHILLVQGLDGTGTEAAESLLFRPGGMDAILDKARLPDGTIGSFEALLESTSIDSHPTSLRVLAIHTPLL